MEPKSEVATRTEDDWEPPSRLSLPEVHGSVPVPVIGGFWRKMAAFAGPGYLVAVGYMDPGNWATDIAGGAKFGYTLLSVILLSNLMAILLQSLSARLGIASGRDLAQACRDAYSRRTTFVLWVLCEIAIAACDLAEVLGAAIALQLLFGIPLLWGVCLTSLDVLLVLYMQHRGFRLVEAIVIVLILGIAGCFAVELWLARPDMAAMASGLVPRTEILRNPEMLYISIGILGATVMPHNLYLHSSIVQTRKYGDSVREQEGSDPLRHDRFDRRAHVRVVHQRRHPRDGGGGRFTALSTKTSRTSATRTCCWIRSWARRWRARCLRSRCSSRVRTPRLTGTLAGQIVMEGFLNIRLRPWLRRLITRLIAIVPAVIVIAIYGEQGSGPAHRAEPGHPQPAAAIRDFSARAVHQQPAE